MMFKDINGPTFVLKAVPVDYTVAELRQKLTKERGLKYTDEVATRFLWQGKQLEDGECQ
jgi:hypothetical protein